MQLQVLYDDDDLIIINKPAGTLVIPDRFDTEQASLNKILEEQLKQQIWVIHRIDRDTSGVICFAKNEQAHRYMSGIFRAHEVEKQYLGLVNGRVIPEEGRIEKHITEHPAVKGKMIASSKGKPSITDYKVAQQWALYSLVQFQIHTGRTHQIRVHTQSMGHSIVCDELYGDGKPFLLSGIKKKYRLSEKDEEERPLLSRLALHASRLAFKKPDGKQLEVEAPLPKDMAATINQLNKWGQTA